MIVSGVDHIGFVQHCNGVEYSRQSVYYCKGAVLSRVPGAKKYHMGYCVFSDKPIKSLSRYEVTYKEYLRLTRGAARANITKHENASGLPIDNSKKVYVYKPYVG